MSLPHKMRPNDVEILVVEDSPTQAEQLRQLLAARGFAVAVAANGREALAAALARPPTLVVTDIVMPEMDGYALCAAIKADARLTEIPVVMVTSLAGIQDIAKSLECGADNFIRKPYDPKTLLTRIEYILLNLELRKTSKVKVGMEVFMGGKKHFIASGREQIVDLLISTYEEAVRMNEELQQQHEEIELSNRMLRVLYRIAAELNRVTSEADACTHALQGMLDLSGFRAGWIYLDEGEAGMRLAAACRLPDALLAPGAMEGDCRCRRMAQAGELRRGALLVECERLQQCGGDGMPRNHVSVALAVGGQNLGVMNVVAESGAVGADDLRMFEAVGNQVAVAIQRVQLYRHLEDLVGQRTAALQAEIVERTRAQAKVAGLNRIYAMLSGINTTIVRVHDRGDLFREACRIAVEQGKFRLAWIGVVEADGRRVRPVACRGDCGETVPAAGFDVGDGVFGKAVGERRTVTCNDADADAATVFAASTAPPGCRSMAVFPLLLGGRADGLLALYATEADVFDAGELELLKELAGDISFALEYIRKGEQVDYLAYYDALTGLPNRNLIHDRLSQLLQAALREPGASAPLALAIVNIERFKSINDTFGRRGGDALLKLVAARLGAALGAADHLARIGSDHFAAILSGIADAADAAHLLDNAILPELARPFAVDDQELHVAVRIGVALFPSDGNDADTLFANAETALGKAVASGERYLFYAPQMNARVAERLSLENKLHNALERGEYVLHYQPKVSLQNGEVVGLEALIRWQDPETGLVSPAEFVPLLEETGMIVDVGRWALEQALADHCAWHAMGLRPPRVAVNVSAAQLRRKDFLDTLAAALRGAGEHRCLDLELTETMLMTDMAANVRYLGAARKMGVKIAVDDFGTGYSSLGYLKRFPIDSLKIDQSFVRDITTSPDAAAICVAVIGLAHNLRLKVIAEGVETEGQMNYLRRHGCDEIQGYLFSRPLAADAFAQLLKERRKLELPTEAEGKRKTLLVVDDEPNVLAALRRVLRRDGYEIHTVESAREGFDILATHEVQVILSDQRMPEMNGTEFLSKVRELYPDTIRIVLSGYTDLETITDAVNRGAIYRFLTKPWDDDLLREHVREAFRHQEAARRKA